MLANSSDIEGEVAIDASVTYSGGDGVLEINGDGTYNLLSKRELQRRSQP
ncbi:cadherin-like domain-containing protein [Vibrio chagasii]|nr:cadherin-like domain-containing protein [Vibrio chagasii]